MMEFDGSTAVREVTDEEVAFYHEHGWVKLKGLVSPDLAAELLEDSKAIKARAEMLEAESANSDQSVSKTINDCDTYLLPTFFHARHIRTQPFLDFIMGNALGKAAHRLIDRQALTSEPIPTRYCEDALLCKTSSTAAAANSVGYHQDGALVPFDRAGFVNIWIAFEEITEDQGTMRFLDRSHNAGPLGSSTFSVLDGYPKLTGLYDWTEFMSYRPGDATAHHAYTIHGSPENRSTRDRWSYALNYFPDDCAPGPNFPEKHGMPAPHERFPIVYP